MHWLGLLVCLATEPEKPKHYNTRANVPQLYEASILNLCRPVARFSISCLAISTLSIRGAANSNRPRNVESNSTRARSAILCTLNITEVLCFGKYHRLSASAQRYKIKQSNGLSARLHRDRARFDFRIPSRISFTYGV